MARATALRSDPSTGARRTFGTVALVPEPTLRLPANYPGARDFLETLKGIRPLRSPFGLSRADTANALPGFVASKKVELHDISRRIQVNLSTCRKVGHIGPQLNHTLSSLFAFFPRRGSLFRYYGGSIPIRRYRKYQVVVIGVVLPPGISTNGPAIR